MSPVSRDARADFLALHFVVRISPSSICEGALCEGVSCIELRFYLAPFLLYLSLYGHWVGGWCLRCATNTKPCPSGGPFSFMASAHTRYPPLLVCMPSAQCQKANDKRANTTATRVQS